MRAFRGVVIGLLLAPLAGALALWAGVALLAPMFNGNGSRDALGNFTFYLPWTTLVIMVATWIIGIPVYLVLRVLNRLEGRYVVVCFGAAAAALWIYGFGIRMGQPLSKKSLSWLVLLEATGVVTGAVFSRMVTPRSLTIEDAP